MPRRQPRVLAGLHQVQPKPCGGIAEQDRIEAHTADQRVGPARGHQEVVAIRPVQPVVLAGAAQDAIAVGKVGQGMPQPDEVPLPERPRLDRQAVGRPDLQHLVAPGDQRPGGGCRDGQRRKRMDATPGGQVDLVDPQLEVDDDVGGRVRGQHEDVRPSPAGQGIRPVAVDQDVVAGTALDQLIAGAAVDHVAARTAGQGRRLVAAPKDRGKRAGVDLQPGDPGAFAGNEEIDLAVDHAQRHRGDVVQRQARQVQLLADHDQPPLGRQGHQRQATIGTPGHDEDPVADAAGRDRLHALKPGVQRVDDMVGNAHHPAGSDLDHTDRG